MCSVTIESIRCPNNLKYFPAANRLDLFRRVECLSAPTHDRCEEAITEDPMKRLAIVLLLILTPVGPVAAQMQPRAIRVAMCFRSLTLAAAPFAVAMRLGWFASAGIDVELVALPGSLECVKRVATGHVDFTLASIEPLAMLRSEGLRAKNFYTAYQGNIYGLMVAAESPIKTIADLKGKRIGVATMASSGVVVARALVADHGMDPDRDISIVLAGDSRETAALLRSNQVDALSQFDTHYAALENMGLKLRPLDNDKIARFPSNGLIALERTLETQRTDAVALARGYAKGTIFSIHNPDAAIRILYEVLPQTRPVDKDVASAIRDDVAVLKARSRNWRLEAGGVTKWGESSQENYAAYVDFLAKWGILRQKADVRDLVTLDLIDEINDFNPQDIVTLAKEYAVE
jgi:NitT/TauT family transport system substrate-binding protein